MSVLTEVLKLFKYDPATDGDMTFNIGQCMNDNWDKLDAAILLAIAAAGAYNPEESYAVGDYCTYKGKLRKCSTAIPTGETWTEAHWTTTTVAEEMQELSSQLSNKLYKYTKMQEAPQSWSELWALEPGIYSWVQQAPLDWQPADTNSGLLRVELTIHSSGQSGGSHTFILSYIDGVNYLRRYFGEQTRDGPGRIAPIATATPPEEHAIVPKNGATFIPGYKNSYYKDQFGRAVVFYSLRFESVPPTDTEIFSLPQSFAPTGGIVTGAAVLSMIVFFPALVVARTDGMVTIGHNVTGYSGPINLHGFLVIETGGAQ